MSRAHSEKQRRLASPYESYSMMKHNLFQLKFLKRRFRDQSHLVLRHFRMRFIINPFNLTIIFQLSDDTPENDHCPRRKIDICCSGGRVGRIFQRIFGQ